MYKVSVIMPVYNTEVCLERALRSVLKQTIGFENIELLVVDDCSTDRCPEIIGKYAQRYSNIRDLRTERNTKTPGAPRNLALEQATAPYVMFLDSDDMLEPDACDTLLGALLRTGADIVSGSYCEIGEGGKVQAPIIDRYERFREGICDISNDISIVQPLSSEFWCKIYRKSIIDENNIRFGFHYIGEDTIFLVRYLACCRSFYYLKKCVYDYRIRHQSLMHTKNMDYYMQLPDFYDALYRETAACNQLSFYDLHLSTDYFLHDFCVMEFTDEDTRDVLEKWWEILKYTAQKDIPCASPAVKVIVRDALRDDFESAVFDLCQFRTVEDERRTQLNDVFSSRSWKIALAIQKLRFWKK